MNDATDKPRAVAGECPSREVLSDLALGKLPMDAIDTFGQHVQSCPACQTILESLDGLEDSVVADLKGHTSPLPLDPQLEEQIREAEQISRVVWGEPTPETPDQPLSGRLGQYEILERIGRGGMGTVYKAMHIRLKRPVAIKVLPAGRLRDPQAVARFQREMEAVGRLDHPNLVRAHDAGEAEGLHFLVMEFLDGTDLGKLVRGSGRLPVADACEAIRQAALGLQYAHEHGLIHRDVKPSNLMLISDGAVKVLDLGLARLTEETAVTGDMTSTGQILGTGNFIAPEQGGDVHQADARSDIYSLGCTLYFLLAGRAPFSGPEYDTFLKKVMAHVREPIPPIRSICSDIPEAVVVVLERMVAKEPDRRFQTAAEVAEAMETLASGNDLGVVAERGGNQGIVQPPHRPSRSRSSRPLLMVLLILVPALVFGGWYVGTRIAKTHADEKSSTPASEEPFMRKSEAEAEGKKIWADMQPNIRKMNDSFAKMRGRVAAQNEETMARLKKATAEANAAGAQKPPPTTGNHSATPGKPQTEIPARPDN